MGIGGTAEIEMVTLRSLLPDCLLWGSAASIVQHDEDKHCATKLFQPYESVCTVLTQTLMCFSLRG